jgi:hypothetical protein
MCGTQVHQLALAWRPGKVTKDAHFHGDTPAPSAVILAKSSAHKGIGRLFSSLQDLLSQLNLSR